MNFAEWLDDIAVPTLRTLHIMCNPIHLHSLKYIQIPCTPDFVLDLSTYYLTMDWLHLTVSGCLNHVKYLIF